MVLGERKTYMATLRELRLEAGLTMNGLARLAKVDHTTVDRAERGLRILDVKAHVIVQALAQKLGRKISVEDVEGLNVM